MSKQISKGQHITVQVAKSVEGGVGFPDSWIIVSCWSHTQGLKRAAHYFRYLLLLVYYSPTIMSRFLPPTSPLLILLSSVPVALSCGTLFVFSVYGTQLAERCNLPSSSVANLNISATVGTSVGGLLGGYITDLYGTQLPVLCSLIFIAVGYKWLHSLYEIGASVHMWQLIAAMFLVGVGSVASYFASLKAVAVSFPKYKGSAQSVTIASFAISSMLFSFVYSRVFHGDVSRFLYFLCVLSAAMQAVGVVFIRVDGHKYAPIEADIVETLPLVLRSSSSIDLTEQENKPTRVTLQHLSFKECLAHPVFWAHFFIMAITQGLGQMYIYCVGFVVKALHYHFAHAGHGDVPSLHSLQAIHVSLIAIFSFAGRLCSGPLSDNLVHRFHCQRHWVTALGVGIMFCGHLALAFPFDTWSENISTINILLSVVSSLIGFAYGLTFATFPAIIADLFSMKNYSVLWGIIYSSTVPGLTFLTKIFGFVYDKNSTLIGDDYVCTKGSLCYIPTFEFTSILSILVFLAIMAFIYSRGR